jgi:predicted DNA-binding transcriptional regulator AlpA
MKRDVRAQAERIGLKPKTLDNWRSQGTGPPYYKLGARIVYDDAETDAWLATRRRTSTSDPGPVTAKKRKRAA